MDAETHHQPAGDPPLDGTFCLPLRLTPAGPVLATLTLDLDRCVELYRQDRIAKGHPVPSDDQMAEWFLYAFGRLADGPYAAHIARLLLGFMEVERCRPAAEAMLAAASPEMLQAHRYRVQRDLAGVRLRGALESPVSEVLQPFLGRAPARLSVGEPDQTNDGREPTLAEYIGNASEFGDRAALADIMLWLCRNEQKQSRQHGAGRDWHTPIDACERTLPLVKQLMADFRDSSPEAHAPLAYAPDHLLPLVRRIEQAALVAEFVKAARKGSYREFTCELVAREFGSGTPGSLNRNWKKLRPTR